MPSDTARTFRRMPLCFIEPQDAIRVIAESVGRDLQRLAAECLELYCWDRLGSEN